jgi:N-methylhydantoinase B
MTHIDPVTLTVIQSGLHQVCNEMDLAHCRAAFSPIISESQDRSNGIYHRDSGELIAQGELGLPIFVGTMQFSTQAVIERAKDIAPGDIFMVNDPYLGGTHLMDVRFVKPYFYRGKLYAWLPTPPKSSRKDCVFLQSSSTRRGSWIRKSCPS